MSFRIPVNHKDNVQLPLNAIKYTVPFFGGTNETTPKPFLSVIIFGFQGFLAELYSHVHVPLSYTKIQKSALRMEYQVLLLEGRKAGLTISVKSEVRGVI